MYFTTQKWYYLLKMEREKKDLTCELGYRNWIDSVAGEAVTTGWFLGDPYLTARGTHLASLVRKIKYDDDRFGLVEAMASSLVEEIKKARERARATEFIDELFVGEEKNKSYFDWEYNFICVEGKYQIMMLLPAYYDAEMVGKKIDLEEVGLWHLVRTERDTYESQVFVNYHYCDSGGRLRHRVVDFNHEEKRKRGRVEYYYFDDFQSAWEAWQKVKEAFILGRKR